VATMSLDRLCNRLRSLLLTTLSHKMASVIERINPVLRGWAGYFKLSQSKRPLEILMAGCVTNFAVSSGVNGSGLYEVRKLMRLGLNEARACHSAFNGRGHWWNSGAPHINQALAKNLWDRIGLISILDMITGSAA